MKILILQRTPRYEFIRDFRDDFEEQGFEVESIPVFTPHHLEQRIEAFRPDLIFCVGSLPGISSVVNERLPVVYYELDKIMSSAFFDRRPLNPKDVVFTSYRDDIEIFEKAGSKNVYYLPFCANIKKHGLITLSYGHDCTFVGSSITGANDEYLWYQQRTRQLAKRAPAVERELDELLLELDKILDAQNKAVALNRYVIPELAPRVLTGDTERRLLFFKLNRDRAINILSKSAASYQRRFWLGQLPTLSVFGDEGWKETPLKNATYMGSLNQYTSSSALFYRSKININIQRIYALSGLSDRVFNVMYSGGFLVSDRNSAILELFEDKSEIVLFSSPEELSDLIRYYLRHDRERESIAKRGQEVICKKHLFIHRIAEMRAKLGEIL